jgi:hypothetical protein
MIDCEHLKKYIITPVLEELGLFSDAAVNLLLGTAAQESALGLYLHQIHGEALGIYQIEPSTYHDLFENYFPKYIEMEHALSEGQYKKDVEKRIGFLAVLDKFDLPNKEYFEYNLIGNLYYSTAIARIIYYRVPEQLPEANDIQSLAKYYKKYYNTENGKASVSSFVRNYEKYVLDK